MPVPGFTLPIALALQASPELKTISVDQRLTVSYRRMKSTLNPKVAIFEGDVTATYGVTVVRTDKLVLYMDDAEQRGIAEGSTTVDDPEGSLKAERLEFRWHYDDRNGTASNVVIDVAGVTVSADLAVFTQEAWRFDGVTLSPCAGDDGLGLKLRSLTVEPGRRAIGRHLEFNVGGRKLASWPRYEVSLDRKSEGLQWPTIVSREGDAYGLGWKGGFELGPSAVLNAQITAFPRHATSGSVYLTKSLLSPDRIRDTITPKSDISTPFSNSYFDHLGVLSRSTERETVGAPRLSASAGVGRGLGRAESIEGQYNKPWDLVAEYGDTFGDWSVFGQGRFQRIGSRTSGYVDRTVGALSVLPPELPIGSSLSIVGRFDSRIYGTEGREHGWGRGLIGVDARLSKFVSIGAAFTKGWTQGAPEFTFDRPEVLDGFHVRVNLQLGPTTIGFLAKRNDGALGWYDHEYYVAQVAGCFEPFILIRERPNSLTFGITLRPLKEFERLRDRAVKRTKGNMPADGG